MTTGYQSDHFQLLSFIGILVFIIINCSEASPAARNRLKAGRNEAKKILHNQYEYIFSENGTTLPKAPEKTSSKCKGKSVQMCGEGRKKQGSSSSNRTNDKGKVAFQSKQLPSSSESNLYLTEESRISYNKNEYMPVPYGPNGYEEVTEARSWITIPLFMLFSIIQFKLIAALFLAVFGPMILLLLIVQGFLFKVTLVLLGLMIT